MWERKVAAYERIIAALHVSNAYSEAYLAATYEHRELPKEQQEALGRRARTAQLDLAKAIDAGGFIASDKAHASLTRELVRRSPSWV